MTWDWKYARMQDAQTTKDDDNDRMTWLKKPAGAPLTTVICSFYFKLMEWAYHEPTVPTTLWDSGVLQ